MKKTTILKTILMAAAMMVGESQAWAQTTLYYRTLTGTESDPADAAEQAWSASDKDGASADSWSGDISNITISESGLELRVDGASSKSITKSITTTANTKLTYDFVWGYPYNNTYSQDGAYTKITIGNNIEFINEKSNGSSYVINGTKTRYANTLNDTKVAIHLEVNTGTMMISNLTITKVSDSSVLLNKTSIPLNEGTVFSSLSIGVKHTTNKTDGTRYTRTVFETIKVTETPQYAYSVHWKSGDTDMGEFTSGYDVNGASITIPYYRYLSTNHELYKISTANNTDVPTVSFTKTTEDQTEYMTGYTQVADAGYVVYCEEAENIEGMTPCSPYTSNRCSGRKAAYCSDYVTITTLPAGTYKVCIGMFGNASDQTFYVQAGETTVLERTFTKSSTRGEATSDAFTIDATTDIKIKGGVAGTAFDNIYIVCTSGRVAAVDNLGYTFSSTLPLDFTGTGVEAYTAAYNSTTKKVDLTRVYKVPANTGLFIKGTAADIPVLTGAADVIGTNNLVAVSAATTVETTSGENTNYVLALVDKDDTSKGVQFLKANGASVGAGKAYLQIPTASAPAPQLMLSFGDVIATGINMVQGDGFKVNGYYDLQGRKVMNPKKGLYIVNGKKVVIK